MKLKLSIIRILWKQGYKIGSLRDKYLGGAYLGGADLRGVKGLLFVTMSTLQGQSNRQVSAIKIDNKWEWFCGCESNHSMLSFIRSSKEHHSTNLESESFKHVVRLMLRQIKFIEEKY